MATKVHKEMERVIPELQNLLKLKLFTKEEITQIVAKRTDFEYKISASRPKMLHFLSYIEYELNLNALRVERKTRLHVKAKAQVSDTSIITRVHSIYSRMLLKFPGDLTLWIQYFDFCKTYRTLSKLSRAYAKAILLNPTVPELYIESAKHQFETNADIATARSVMQRGIRLNKTSKKLWIEYLRLELLHREKISLRLQVSESIEDVDENAKRILSNEIIEVIIKNAIRALPENLAFVLQLLDITLLFEGTGNTAQDILSSLSSIYANDATYLCYLCRLPFSISKTQESLLEAIKLFKTTLSSVPSISLLCGYLKFIQSAADTINDPTISGPELVIQESNQYMSAISPTPEFLSLVRDAYISTAKLDMALVFIKRLLEEYPSEKRIASESLAFLYVIRHEYKHAHDWKSIDQLIPLLNDFEYASLYINYFEQQLDKKLTNEAYKSLILKKIDACYIERYIAWVFKNYCLDKARLAYKWCIKFTNNSQDAISAAKRFEQSLATADIKVIRSLDMLASY